MGCRDRVREQFLFWFQLWVALGWARVRIRRARAGGGDSSATAKGRFGSLNESHTSYASCTKARGARPSTIHATLHGAALPQGFDAKGVNLSSAKSDHGPLLFCRMTELQFLVAGSKA